MSRKVLTLFYQGESVEKALILENVTNLSVRYKLLLGGRGKRGFQVANGTQEGIVPAKSRVYLQRTSIVAANHCFFCLDLL